MSSKCTVHSESLFLGLSLEHGSSEEAILTFKNMIFIEEVR